MKNFISIFILCAAVILTAVLVISKRQPASSPEVAEVVEMEMTADDITINKALEIIESGGAPMEGILKLKEIADREDNPNVRAIMLLGQLSVQSGQMEKARERYLKVLELEPDHIEATWSFAMLNMQMGALEDAVEGFSRCVERDETMTNGYFFMAQCQEAMGLKEEALSTYKVYLPFAPDTAVSNSVKEFINRLEAEVTATSGPNS